MRSQRHRAVAVAHAQLVEHCEEYSHMLHPGGVQGTPYGILDVPCAQQAQRVRRTARAIHRRARAPHATCNILHCATARAQRVTHIAWHVHHVARSIVRNFEARSEHLQHATHDVRTKQARTNRFGVRDRAADERDGPILHVNHAAAGLRTSRRSQAYCNRPLTPSADIHRHGESGTTRIAAPP